MRTTRVYPGANGEGDSNLVQVGGQVGNILQVFGGGGQRDTFKKSTGSMNDTDIKEERRRAVAAVVATEACGCSGCTVINTGVTARGRSSKDTVI